MKHTAILAASLSVALGACAGLLATGAQTAEAAPVIVTARPVVVARPAAAAVRVSPTTTRSSSSTSYRSSSSTFLPLYVPLMIAANGSHAAQAVDVATPLLTICTADQLAKAKAWQEDCKNLNDVSSGYCPLLSYFRFCEEAAPDDVKGLKPAGEHYRHVFLAK